MGSFIGHLVPGLFLCFFATRWTFLSWYRYFTYDPSNNRTSGSPVCQASYPCPLGRGVPLEGLVKVVACSIGMVGEYMTAFVGGHFVYMGNVQHFAMYFFFAINGLADIAAHYRTTWVPPGSDYATMAVATFVQGLLFAFHLHGRVPLDAQVHQLLIIAIFMTLAAILIEWSNRDQVLCVVFRNFCTLLQGTWFVQVGFILHSPIAGHVEWADHDHTQLMLVTAIFVAHMAASLVSIMAVAFLVHSCVGDKAHLHSGPQYQKLDQDIPCDPDMLA
ncbi:Transmembrane protein 45B [Halotydeus destructor]|nr:Transmembrane protein 45B [Halotydeus destructor]